jgi:hypothetical protein
MTDLIWSGCLLFIGFLIQLVVWRFRTPERQGRAILVIFFLVLILGLISDFNIDYRAEDAVGSERWISLNPINWVTLYILCVFAYLISFTALEAESPSIEIIRRLSVVGSKGISATDLEKQIATDALIVPRIHDLVRDRMIRGNDSRYSLTTKGWILNQLFLFQRSAFRLGPGG